MLILRTLFVVAVLAWTGSVGFDAARGQAVESQRSAAAPLGDGPYVDVGPDGGWRARALDSRGEVHAITPPRERVEVAAVETVPAFSVTLRRPATIAASILPLPSNTPLAVIADTHGEFSILVSLLQRQKIVDAQLRWSFGRGQLVVTGDMLDRGAHQIEILWLLYKLEAEAAKAGGRVHVLLGNHETMVMRGDLRYLNPRYVKSAEALGASSYPALLGSNTVLGQWLRSRPAVLKLGDLLLLHGGISPAVVESGLSLDAINASVRASLATPNSEPLTDATAKLVMGPDGPLWYRGYFPLDGKPPTANGADVDAVRARFGVQRILVGHTIVEKVTPLFDGRVLAVQVYPTRDEASGAPLMEAALRIDGRWFRMDAQGHRMPLDLDGKR